jgi:osmoprotectant transport system permease protein
VLRTQRRGIDPLVWLVLAFALLLALMPASRPLFAWGFPAIEPPVYDRASFFMLFLSHAELVAISGIASTFIAVGLGIFVTRPAGREFRTIVNTIATIGLTFPPAAVLAIAVPLLGYGALPTLLALTLYGLLPILANTIAGLEGAPPAVREAALGVGLSPLQVLLRVELPLAAPVILAGIRVSVIIGIGTATIGSTVGAVTLGTPIIDGLVTGKLPYVLQGAVIVALFAIIADRAFELLERRLAPPGPE